MAARKWPVLAITTEDITPAIAVEMLLNNTRNRKVSKRLVSKYAETMREGEWRLTGEPIIFDKNGVLQSGQHRLLAVIESGATIRTVVVRNADPEAVYSIDAGRTRRMADVLRLRGETNVVHLGAALSWLWRWENDAMDMTGETATNAHLLALLDKTPEIRDHLTPGKLIGQRLGFSYGMMTTLHYIMTYVDEEDCKVFTAKIRGEADIGANDPVRKLIDWAHNTRMKPRKPSQVHIAAIYIKAWNAFREHEEPKFLRFEGREIFPEIV